MKLLMKIVKSSLNEIDVFGTRHETRAIVGEYKSVSARFGSIGDSVTSEYLNQKLEKNEGNIKNWVKGVSNNE